VVRADPLLWYDEQPELRNIVSKKKDEKLVAETVRLAAQLRIKLQNMGVHLSDDTFLDRLPVDVADVYFICASYQDAVQRFLALSDGSNPREVLKIIWELEQHLFIHLPYHYKSIAKGLSKLETAVEPSEDAREQLALERLMAIGDKLSEAIRTSTPTSRRRRTPGTD
jgi:hypothetical protein